ncbi:hypothetical protein CB1_000842003, partial [Camelus ferus]
EDMNLNEDKKAPLREKDFSIKKEMVMQYINTASKTLAKCISFEIHFLPGYLLEENVTGTDVFILLSHSEDAGGNLVRKDDGIEGQGEKIVKIHSPVQHCRFPSLSEDHPEEREEL